MTLAELGAAAAARARAAIAARVAVELPGVIVTDRPGGVELAAPGLRARAFGTRRTPRDPRLVALLEGRR